MSEQVVDLQTKKVAMDNAYKRLAQLHYIMKPEVGLSWNQIPKVVAKIFEGNVNIDYQLPTSSLFTLNLPELLSNTALMLAAKNPDIRIFTILIERGADFTRKNKQGSTVLHQVIDTSVHNDDTVYWKLDAQKLKNELAELVLDAHVKFSNSCNPRDEHGLSHFHVACMMNHEKAVEFFLNAGVSPNEAINNESPNLPGYTPLHLAVKFRAFGAVQILLKMNVKIDAKNAKGMSPLELMFQDHLCMSIELIKLTKRTPNLDTYWYEYKSTMYMIMQKIDPQTQAVDQATGLSRFHIACTMDLETVREQLQLIPDLQHSVNAKSTLWPGYTALHFAAHYDFEVFEMLLDAGADLLAVDSKGQTPFDMCLRNFNLRVIENILDRRDNLANVLFSNGQTRLLDFVFFLRNFTSFDYFLSNYLQGDINIRIPEDSPIWRGYTLLHLTVACCEEPRGSSAHESSTGKTMTDRYRSCLQACLNLGADVTAKNSQGLTPVHLAFQLKNDALIKMLLDHQTSGDNPRDNTGLTHLHMASLVNCPSLVRKLSGRSDDLEAPLEIGDFVWTKSSHIKNGATPLSIALSVGARETVEALIEQGARIPEADAEKFAKMLGTRLLLRLHPLDVERVLRHCEPKLLVTELEGNAQLRDYLVERHGFTRLHIAVLTGGTIDELKDDVNARVPIDSPMWSGCTALHLLMFRRQFSKATTVARLLLDRGANATLKNARGATPVHDAFDWFLHNEDVFSLVDMLICQFDVNPVDSRGLSHFHLAVIVGKVDMVEGFLRNGVGVNEKIDEFSDTFAGLAALHLAAAWGRDEAVKTLLAHGADVHCENVVGDRPIHVAAVTGLTDDIGNIVKSLMSAGADINGKNLLDETPLERLLNSSHATVEKVQLFLKYGCQVNAINSISNVSCLALAMMTFNNKSIYESLINVYDHNELDEFGRNAMHNIVLLKESIRSILHGDRNRSLPSADYVTRIQELTGMGLDIDFQDKLGMTPLHLATTNQNVSGVIGLLKCGADVNINEIKGLPAIAASMSDALKYTPDKHYDEEILQNFQMHIWKLYFFKLHVSDFNLKAGSKMQERKFLKPSMIRSWQVEVQSINKENIGSIALRGFLCETGVVAAYPTMPCDSRSCIDKYFETNFNRLLEEFPSLSCLLLLQYRKARKRRDIAESCKTALKYLVNFEIPDLCSEPIIRFLSYDDLKNLITAANFE